MKRLLVLLLLLLPLEPAASQTDPWGNLVYFGGCPINHIPKGITIPDKDPQCRSIMNAIIAGATLPRIREQFPDSLDFKLEELLHGGVIKQDGENFKPAFPVLTGADRARLRETIHQRLNDARLPMDSLILPLRSALHGAPEMVFHFLWSRVIDDCWWNLYNTEFQTDKGPPSIAFIVSPPHPYQCGTNFDNTPDNGQIAISWSYNLFDDFFRLPQTASFYNLALHNPVPGPDSAFFLRHGLMDFAGSARLFTYKEGDSLDQMCDGLKNWYAGHFQKIFDYRKLSGEFHIPADELFLVIAHEAAYELFDMLDRETASMSVPITVKNNPSLDFHRLVSIRMH